MRTRSGIFSVDVGLPPLSPRQWLDRDLCPSSLDVGRGGLSGVQVCSQRSSLRKCGSITIDGGVVSLLMNTGRSVCDLNRHALSLLNTHSLIKSATNIGGF